MVPRPRVRVIVTIVAATATEARAVREFVAVQHAADSVRVIEAGIALVKKSDIGDIAISCGLAGGLRDDVPTASVLIPARVRRPDGTELECDAQLVQRLRTIAEEFGHAVIPDPLVTSATFVYGAERAHWAAQGYVGVDMETGLLRAPRVACVRVVLDTPKREISPAWMRPATAMLHPGAWRDLPFLMREGPRCSRIAARIAAYGAARTNEELRQEPG